MLLCLLKDYYYENCCLYIELFANLITQHTFHDEGSLFVTLY